MELRQLRTFEAVVRHGTVTDAAVALDLAPSSVSEQIRTLERSLGVALFSRGPKGMRPTAAGDRLLVWSRRLLSQAEQARREVIEAKPALRLGALETIAAALVPAVLARIAERRPDLDIDVRPESSRDVLLAGVVANDLEAALLLDLGQSLGDLGFDPPAAPLDFLDVDRVRLVLVAAPAHPLCGAAHLVPDDLKGQRLLVNTTSLCSFSLVSDRILGAEVERVRAGGVAVMRSWAKEGLGMALLPEFAVTDELAAGTLVALDLPAPDLTVRLVWRPDREDLPGMREVLYAAST